MNKNRRIAAVMNENLNRKSESHAFWKNQLLENQESYENCPEQVISPTENKLSKMPSMETIRRSLSQINFDCPKSKYLSFLIKRFEWFNQVIQNKISPTLQFCIIYFNDSTALRVTIQFEV